MAKETSHAAAIVLSTYELLEKILLSVSRADIARLQRVNKDWSNVVQRSHPLQKELLRMPDPGVIESLRPGAYYLYHPAIVRVNPIIRVTAIEHADGKIRCDEAAESTTIPSAYIKNRLWVASPRHNTGPVCETSIRISLPLSKEGQKLPFWYTFPITRPAVKVVQFAYSEEIVYNCCGVTFGDAIETWRKLKAQSEGIGQQFNVYDDEDCLVELHLMRYLADDEEFEEVRMKCVTANEARPEDGTEIAECDCLEMFQEHSGVAAVDGVSE